MAPEIISEEKGHGMPADVFSFSLILYELMTMKQPYSDRVLRPMHLILQVAYGTLRPTIPDVRAFPSFVPFL